jgi:hypothetical protein
VKSLSRHQRAYQVVTGWSGAVRKKAVELAQGYPIELRTSGTMQTLAFSIGKGEPGHAAMAQAIADWVLSDRSGAPLGSFDDKERNPRKLLGLLAEARIAQYVAADAEAIAFADAIKIIGKAVEGVGDGR